MDEFFATLEKEQDIGNEGTFSTHFFNFSIHLAPKPERALSRMLYMTISHEFKGKNT